MKTTHFVRKYNLNLNSNFDHKKFSTDFGNEFIARIELAKHYSNWSLIKFFGVVDEMEARWDNINNKTVGNLPDKLWYWMYYNIMLPQKDVEFPEVKKEELRIEAMDIESLRHYILQNSTNTSWTYINAVQCAEIEWDHNAVDNGLGDLQLRPNYDFKRLDNMISDERWIITYAFRQLEYQLKKSGAAKAKIQFKINMDERKRYDSFNWSDLYTRWMGKINVNEYLVYFQMLNIKAIEGITMDMINKSFRALSMKYHPDKGGNKEKFVEIIEAKNKCIEYINAIK
jgi:hypothetical protein